VSRIAILTFLLFALSTAHATAQESYERKRPVENLLEVDTNYIRSFPGKVTGRLFLSQKYTNLQIIDGRNGPALEYEPNTTLNLGVGATAGLFTLNLAYGFEFLNPDVGKGSTRYLDLQSHVYSRKLVIDFFGQFYRGLYLSNTSEHAPDYPKPYYIRGDIYEQVFGLTAFYLFNHEKYSFRAALVQNEQQLKSAGSWLLGAEGYYTYAVGDSALVPSFMPEGTFNNFRTVNQLIGFKVGPSGGYAHTFVIAKHFFIMISFTVQLGIGRYSTFRTDREAEVTGAFNASTFGRYALGYNSEKWFLGLSSVDNAIGVAPRVEGVRTIFGIGNARLNFAWRFAPPTYVKKYTDFLE
jgi:hypothetical protein